MSKPVISTIASNYDVVTVNANFASIVDYIDLYLLHRDGEGSPAVMLQDLDMNSNNIVNLGYATEADHAVPLAQQVEIQSGDLSSIEDIDFP